METFAGRLAVVTGGGTGMGRELVLQLASEGCSVAACDLHPDTLGETVTRARDVAPASTKITAHGCDVSNEADVQRFRDEVVEQHATDHINLLFNNAGIGGGSSFVTGERDEWERVFGVCWGGVYNCSRAFVPLLVASDDGYLVNTSSVNGFWACLGPNVVHTAYSTAKFAVKGFSEALITDFRVHAPHVKVAVVMPGHIGTEIVHNSRRVLQGDDEGPSSWELTTAREAMTRMGMPTEGVTDEQLVMGMRMMADGFRDGAPVSAAQAAKVILDGVRNDEWRILIGDDARALDEAVRRDPIQAYEALSLPTITNPV